MPRLRQLITALLLGALLPAGPALAWADHDVLTREILRPVSWLNSYRQIKVTKWDYAEADKGPYSPDFRPIFIDKLPGDVTTAREILLRYVDEPDWGMDAGLEASPLQKVAGSSEAYRHRCDHFMHGAVRVGDAPRRAKVNYELARIAFGRKDTYWGFRYLARTLHYLEDMGDPYDTTPLRWKYLMDTRFDVTKLRTMLANLKIHYEALVSDQIKHQSARGGGPFVGAIADGVAADVFDPEVAAAALGDFTHERADELFDACDRYWPKRARSQKQLQSVRPEELNPVEPPPSWATIQEITSLDLHVMSKMARGLMALAKRDLLAPPRTDDDE